MDELNALRQELADLRREVRTLKRTRWITPTSLACFLLTLVALGVAAPKKQDPQEDPNRHRPTQIAQDLVCKSIRLVDAQNHEMILMGSDKDGGFFVLNGADGKKRSYMAVENNGGFTDWYDAAGVRRASVFVGDKGSELRLTDKADHIAVVMQQGETGGSMQINGADNNNRIHAGVDNGGGYLDIADSLGNLRESFYLNDKNVAQFKLVGADKVARFLASGNPDSGQLIAYGEDGKAKGMFPAK